MRRVPAAVLLLSLAVLPLRAASVLPFITDDYTRALAEAKRKNVAIFVDAWAPW